MDKTLPSLDLPLLSSRMKGDWDCRALENHRWFINTVSIDQSDDEFFEGGKREVQESLLPDFRQVLGGLNPRDLRLLEIGCGVGRMTCHLAEIFGEVWAVDVSGEMIRKARQRFGHISNIKWIEYDGIDVGALPENYFDLAFSIYVYQHVPSKEVISGSIASVFSRLRPGGSYKFQTNGIENSDYEEIEKDTWTGTTFTACAIRELAKRLDARLLGIRGSGTPYCWSTLRRRHDLRATGGVQPVRNPRILMAGLAPNLRTNDVPLSGEDASVALVVSGLDDGIDDCNSMRALIADHEVFPAALRAIAESERPCLEELQVDSTDVSVVEVEIPVGLEAGRVDVALKLGDGSVSGPISIELSLSKGRLLKIVTVRNGFDFGTDVYRSGAKAVLNLYVAGLDESASIENVGVTIGGYSIRPDFVGFVRENGTWQVNARLPDQIATGLLPLNLHFKNLKSADVPVEIRSDRVKE